MPINDRLMAAVRLNSGTRIRTSWQDRDRQLIKSVMAGI